MNIALYVVFYKQFKFPFFKCASFNLFLRYEGDDDDDDDMIIGGRVDIDHLMQNVFTVSGENQ